VLEQKGRLKQSASGRGYVYNRAQPQSEVVGGMVRDFIARVLQWHVTTVARPHARRRQDHGNELVELKKLLKEKRRKR
jgi:predicted transcriptional regulator